MRQPGEEVTEYGQLMSGGGYSIRWDDPEMEEIYPVAKWIEHNRRHGGRVFRRKIIIVEDWIEVKKP